MKTKFLIAVMAIAIGAVACNSDHKAANNDSLLLDSTTIDTASTDSMGVMDTTHMNMQDSLGNAKNPRP